MSSSLYISILPDCTFGFPLYIHDFPLPEIKRLIRIIAESEVGLGEYAKSEETRMKLINAAGEIIATGGLSALTIRGVAHRAGENISSIHYHFGNKEGLLIATVTYAMSEWMKYDWQEFVKQRSRLFRDDTGKAIVIRELVDILFELSFSSNKPRWCSRKGAISAAATATTRNLSLPAGISAATRRRCSGTFHAGKSS